MEWVRAFDCLTSRIESRIVRNCLACQPALVHAHEKNSTERGKRAGDGAKASCECVWLHLVCGYILCVYVRARPGVFACVRMLGVRACQLVCAFQFV
eukprot:6172954-Pleurochrysis_carterae.AAC.2